MALLNHIIANLSGGVSKQASELRFDNQFEEQINCTATITESLRKRNPTVMKAELGIDLSAPIGVHSYDRGDGSEQYIFVIEADGTVNIMDLDGAPYTVNHQGTVKNYLASTTPSKDIRFLTVGDVTFALNKTKTVAMTASTTTAHPTDEAYYWVKRVSPDSANQYTYYITVNGTTYSQSGTNSNTVANSLASTINAVAGLTAEAKDSLIRITGVTSFASGDSWGDQASFGWFKEVAKLSDLPAKASYADDIIFINITGTDTNEFTNYYIKWNGTSWVETSDGGILDTLNNETLPITITRESNGTFTVDYVTDWGMRLKGDDNSNPIPSFVDTTITDIFFFKNRLGFATGENVVLSEVGSYYNFFATTVLEVLDGDVIDVAIDSNDVANIRYVGTLDNALILFSDKNQYRLSGEGVLSPSTTRISLSTSFEFDKNIRPINLTDNVVFIQNMLTYSRAMQYYSGGTVSANTAVDISSHVIGYIPQDLEKLESSSSNNMIFAKSSTDDRTIYVYRYEISNEQRVQSSWSKWTFSRDIKEYIVEGNSLYLLTKSGSYNMLEAIRLDSNELTTTFKDNAGHATEASYEARATLSEWTVYTRDRVKNIRGRFMLKTFIFSYDEDSKFDIEIYNKERNQTTTINDRYKSRKLFIGSQSSNQQVSIVSSYGDAGFRLDSVSIEGQYSERSRNI